MHRASAVGRGPRVAAALPPARVRISPVTSAPAHEPAKIRAVLGHRAVPTSVTGGGNLLVMVEGELKLLQEFHGSPRTRLLGTNEHTDPVVQARTAGVAESRDVAPLQQPGRVRRAEPWVP